jgi:acyl-CoA synthetase (NDP forming)
MIDAERIRAIVAPALAEGRAALTELEGMDVLDAMGLETPARAFVRDADEAARAVRGGAIRGDRAVVKVVSPAILHKTEVGGVAMSLNTPIDIAAAIRRMAARLAERGLAYEGFSINELVAFEPALGREIIAGYRLAPDFGPIVSLGFGGIHAEYIAKAFRPGAATIVVSPATVNLDMVQAELSHNALQEILAGGLRGTKRILGLDTLASLALAFSEAAPSLAAAGVLELEVNPFAVCGEGVGARLVALDALAKIGPPPPGIEERGGRLAYAPQAARPVAKIDRLLRPASAAVIGVSEKAMNNGRIILRNLLSNGFDPARIYVVKPGAESVDGCRCVPDVASLPEKVDLFVLVIPAAKSPGVLADLVEHDKAESIIVIPGGFEEKAGTEAITARMRSALARSRESGGGPIIVGGNCLGVLSVPGKYNTLFIPEYKLPRRPGASDPVALISQSGAFAITRLSNHPGLAPKYVVTCGNQMDATIGDFLDRMAGDESIRIFAVYIEGFRPLDGEKALLACGRITSSGRTVIVYRAGRSAAGAEASASHTASIAGDYQVTRALFTQAGAIVADSLEEFDDALTTFALLEGKERLGDRLGALSNAGFECVAMADNLGGLRLAQLAPATIARLGAAFAAAGIGEIVDVHNPVDLTPMADDAAYEECFRALLDDSGVDCAIAGIVPLTARLQSLAPGPGHDEDSGSEGGIAARYGRLMAESRKPWVAVVDSGPLYDGLARELESRGVPTFRSADRALKALDLWAGTACTTGVCG